MAFPNMAEPPLRELLVNNSHSASNELCNFSADYCSKNSISANQVGTLTAVALVRMVTSILSILGAVSIILSALIKRQVKSSKVHPIFVLSIADCMLAVLWVIGGILWMKGVEQHRVWCFSVTLMTVILECIAINLTLVYALYAYAHIKHMNLSSLIANYFQPTHGWPRSKVIGVYFVAWVLPTVLVMIPFSFIAGLTNILPNANRCSCGCVPKFANVLPYPRYSITDKALMSYMTDIGKLDLSFSVLIAAHYVIVFPLLVFYYYRVLRHIRRLRKAHEGNTSSPLYGATEALIVKGHSQAKHRVFMFLTVFVVTGFCNLILACSLTVIISLSLTKTVEVFGHFLTALHVILIVQSITVPLQGFLNAIVYGWTREDFLYVMASTSRIAPLQDPGPKINDIDDDHLNDGVLSDLDSSYYESDGEQINYRNSRQQTPETNLSGHW